MIKILMVCLGNICRSPLAEGILRDKIENSGISAIVHSSGTASYHAGDSADPRSVDVAQRNNIDISRHSAQQFKQSDFDTFDFIYAMDSSNYDNIVELAGNEIQKSKVKILMNEVVPGENLSVPDPYYGGKHGFDNVFEMIDQACDKIVENLNQ